MTSSTKLAALPTVPARSPLEQARESWHASACPVEECGELKKAHEHFFCLKHWKALPEHVQRGLKSRHVGRMVQFWIEAMKVLKGER